MLKKQTTKLISPLRRCREANRRGPRSACGPARAWPRGRPRPLACAGTDKEKVTSRIRKTCVLVMFLAKRGKFEIQDITVAPMNLQRPPKTTNAFLNLVNFVVLAELSLQHLCTTLLSKNAGIPKRLQAEKKGLTLGP